MTYMSLDLTTSNRSHHSRRVAATTLFVNNLKTYFASSAENDNAPLAPGLSAAEEYVSVERGPRHLEESGGLDQPSALMDPTEAQA